MTGSRSGPVRSEAARRAILTATAELFAERGYDHLTIEGIAARAGVGKQTIYRWWPTRGAVIAECMMVGGMLPEQLALPDTGDLRRDLTAWLESVFAVAQSPTGEKLLRSIIAAAAEHAEIGKLLRASLMGTDSIEGRLQRARGSSSEFADDRDLELVVESLIGAVLLRALSRSPIEPGDAGRIVDTVLGPRMVTPLD